MEYDIELQHKPGKTMIPADVRSRRHDHSIGIEEVEDIIGLPEELFIKLLDLDLRDAVVSGQRKDGTAQEVLVKLSDPEIQHTKWRVEEGPDSSRCLFYDGKLYVPDDLDLRRKIVL